MDSFHAATDDGSFPTRLQTGNLGHPPVVLIHSPIALLPVVRKLAPVNAQNEMNRHDPHLGIATMSPDEKKSTT